MSACNNLLIKNIRQRSCYNMSRQTENFFKGFSQFAEGQDFESEEELNEALHSYMLQYNASVMQGNRSNTPETADDFLELAEEAESQKEALKYAKKALNNRTPRHEPISSILHRS